MANVYGTTAVTLRDYKGYTARVNILLTSSISDTDLVAQATNFATDIVAVSNAVLAHQTGLVVADEVTLSYGTAAQYSDVSQKLVIRGVDTATGNIHRISIPAPLASQFLTDLVTWDPTQTASATLKTFLNAHWVSPALNPILVLDGREIQRRRKQRLGPWTRTPIGGPAGG